MRTHRSGFSGAVIFNSCYLCALNLIIVNPVQLISVKYDYSARK